MKHFSYIVIYCLSIFSQLTLPMTRFARMGRGARLRPRVISSTYRWRVPVFRPSPYQPKRVSPRKINTINTTILKPGNEWIIPYAKSLGLIGMGASLGVLKKAYATEQPTPKHVEYNEDMYEGNKNIRNPLSSEDEQKIATALKELGFKEENGSYVRDDPRFTVPIRLYLEENKNSADASVFANTTTEDGKVTIFQLGLSVGSDFLNKYTAEELRAAIAHELGHVNQIFSGRLTGPPSSITEARALEKEADLEAVEALGNTSDLRQVMQKQNLEKNKTCAIAIGSGMALSAFFCSVIPALGAILATWYLRNINDPHPTEAQRIAYIQEYAEKQGWEKTEDGYKRSDK